MAPRVDRIASDPVQPDSAPVVIVGGGIIGVCTAFFLARAGVPVVLCEKGEIAGEQSSRNWGWCRTMGCDEREVPLAVEALRLWGGMNKAVEAETGFRRPGLVYLCRPKRNWRKRKHGSTGSAGRTSSIPGCSAWRISRMCCPACPAAGPGRCMRRATDAASRPALT